jgi:hypothetical protein
MEALAHKTCDRCGAAVHRERHRRTCATRAEILMLDFDHREALLQRCTTAAFRSLLPGGRFAHLAPRFL